MTDYTNTQATGTSGSQTDQSSVSVPFGPYQTSAPRVQVRWEDEIVNSTHSQERARKREERQAKKRAETDAGWAAPGATAQDPHTQYLTSVNPSLAEGSSGNAEAAADFERQYGYPPYDPHKRWRSKEQKTLEAQRKKSEEEKQRSSNT
nr:uncharacterized protein CI109_006557 [Kwoniella shandongensis]KAA5525095.1 hypothetical protein CI109_006557 [Kwoniella shandongensis]